MNGSTARFISAVVMSGFAASFLAFCGGCSGHRSGATPSTHDSLAKEQRAPQPQTAGAETTFFAVVDLNQDASSPIKILSKNNLMVLQQTEPHTFIGHLDLKIRCRSDVPLTASVAAIPPVQVPGNYSCALSVPEISAPGGIVEVWVKIEKANLRDTPPGSKIATVRLRAAVKG